MPLEIGDARQFHERAETAAQPFVWLTGPGIKEQIFRIVRAALASSRIVIARAIGSAKLDWLPPPDRTARWIKSHLDVAGDPMRFLAGCQP